MFGRTFWTRELVSVFLTFLAIISRRFLVNSRTCRQQREDRGADLGRQIRPGGTEAGQLRVDRSWGQWRGQRSNTLDATPLLIVPCVGRHTDCGSECRGFESPHPPLPQPFAAVLNRSQTFFTTTG
jgi:hypothetical protein